MTYNDIIQIMNQQKIFHSLPKKTQPINRSTEKHQQTTAAKSVTININCPEISQFRNQKNSDNIYIHQLDIDYGRLERPNHFYFNGPRYEKAVKMAEEFDSQIPLSEQMNTRRVTGISLLASQKYMQEKNTEKKNRKVEYLNQKTEQSRPATNSKGRTKVKLRLTEVKAYDEMTKRESSVKRLHSRIVKMMVGGGKITTKVISYPDNEEYLKLCGLK